jgi:hypothetical protein
MRFFGRHPFGSTSGSVKRGRQRWEHTQGSVGGAGDFGVILAAFDKIKAGRIGGCGLLAARQNEKGTSGKAERKGPKGPKGPKKFRLKPCAFETAIHLHASRKDFVYGI